jgi:hypothetical protein
VLGKPCSRMRSDGTPPPGTRAGRIARLVRAQLRLIVMIPYSPKGWPASDAASCPVG